MALRSFLTRVCQRAGAASWSSSPTPELGVSWKWACRSGAATFSRKRGYASSMALFGGYRRTKTATTTLTTLASAVVLARGVDEGEEDLLVAEVKKAKMNEAREKYMLAEEHYHAALRINDDQKKADVIDEKKFIAHRAWILDAMANMAVSEQKPHKAEKLFKEVISLLIQLGAPPESPSVLEISLKLANIYALMEEDEEKMKAAESGFVYVLESQGKTVQEVTRWKSESSQVVPDGALKESQALLGWAHECYAKFLLQRRRLQEALEHFNKSFEVAEKVYGRKSESYAGMLNDAAASLAERNLFEPAIAMLEESLALAEGQKWDGEPAFLINLGVVYLQRKMFDKAKEFCTKGLELGVKIKSDHAVDEASYCLNEWKKKVAEADKSPTPS